MHSGSNNAIFTTAFTQVGDNQEAARSFNCRLDLQGRAWGSNAFYEKESFTADLNHLTTINALTGQAGHLYVLLTHVPVSGGTIYALRGDSTIVPFPYNSTDGWQNLFYAYDTMSMPFDTVWFSQADFRQIGCSQCLGPAAGNSYGEEIFFGEMPLNLPSNRPYNSSIDFRYLAGDLYLATYVADGTPGQAFDFNHGLIELQKLKIHSLAGTWRVASEYYGQTRVHPDLLQVQEAAGQLTAVWGKYHPEISYSNSESAYIIKFTLAGYQYTYVINRLDAHRFSGYYDCEYQGKQVVDHAPVSGERLR
jgi:hypothetical protein